MPMTTTVDTLVNFFTGQGAFDGLGVQQMKDWYEWRGLDYEETVRLKERWVQQWRKGSAEAPPERDRLRAELARAIVGEWGGVRGNRQATLNQYIEDMDNELEEIPFQGIASRSKPLPLLDPKRYVIMDARVVIALNATQFLKKPDKGRMFPEPPSRNTFFHRGGANGYLRNPEY